MADCRSCIHVDTNYNEEPCYICVQFKDGFSLYEMKPESKEDIDDKPSLIGRSPVTSNSGCC